MKLRDSNGEANFTLPVSNGLLRPEHVKRMGDAVWLELLLEDMVTDGEGDDGIVLKGRPICDRELATRLGVSDKTIARYRTVLLGHYIVVERMSYGYSYRVLKSKKWLAIRRLRSDKPVQSDRTKMSDHPSCDRTHSAFRSAGSVRSNKETKSGLIKNTPPPDKHRQADPRFQPIIDAYYQGMRNGGIEPHCDKSDFGALKSWLKNNSARPLESIIASLSNALVSTDPYPLKSGFRLREFLEHEAKYQRGPLLKQSLKPVPTLPVPNRPRNELSPEGQQRLAEYGVAR